MNACCIFIADGNIILLDNYNANDGGYGYGYNYGQNYGAAQPLAIAQEKIGRVLGAASVNISYSIKEVNNNHGLTTSADSCSASFINEASISIKTDCWAGDDVNFFFGENYVTSSASTVNNRIYRSLKKGDALPLDGWVDSFVASYQPSNIPLINGIDYVFYDGMVRFFKDISLASGAYIDFTAQLKAYRTTKIKNINRQAALKITGVNLANSVKERITIYLPNVWLRQDNNAINALNGDNGWNFGLIGKIKKDVQGELMYLIRGVE